MHTKFGRKIKKGKHTFHSVINKHTNKVETYLTTTMEEFRPTVKKLTFGQTANDPTSQIINNCNLAKSSILVNGAELSPSRAGHNVVVLNGNTGLLYKKYHYNTKTDGFAAHDMMNDLKNIPIDSIVVIATQVKLH